MSGYAVLRDLYYGESSNADISSRGTRALLHIPSALEEVAQGFVQRGLDLVLTGNPGDGKSHIARAIQEAGGFGGAEVVLDLSASPTPVILARWRGAARSERGFVLCGNEAPLRILLREASRDEALRPRVEKLQRQLGALVVARAGDLAEQPTRAALVDLADRNLMEGDLITNALVRLCRPELHPQVPRGGHTSAGQNLTAVGTSWTARGRLAALLSAAARRDGRHFTFRHLWAALAFALTGARAESSLGIERREPMARLDATPLTFLCRRDARGPLCAAVRAHADPATVPHPGIEDELWRTGRLSGGWSYPVEDADVTPRELWRRGEERQALRLLARLKRAVALFHPRGGELIEPLLEINEASPRRLREDLRPLLESLRRLYMTRGGEERGPGWLRRGLPLWVAQGFRDVPLRERPHVAAAVAPAEEFKLLRPTRAPWLEAALGPPPELAWLYHEPSGEGLRLTPALLHHLYAARAAAGPVSIPPAVQRFLSRLAGEEERRRVWMEADDEVVVIDRPRGGEVIAARVRALAEGGFTYG